MAGPPIRHFCLPAMVPPLLNVRSSRSERHVVPHRIDLRRRACYNITALSSLLFSSSSAFFSLPYCRRCRLKCRLFFSLSLSRTRVVCSLSPITRLSLCDLGVWAVSVLVCSFKTARMCFQRRPRFSNVRTFWRHIRERF